MSFTAFLVDDDPGVLKALCRIMRLAGYEARAYASPAEFLCDHDPSLPGCAVLDLNMPGSTAWSFSGGSPRAMVAGRSSF